MSEASAGEEGFEPLPSLKPLAVAYAVDRSQHAVMVLLLAYALQRMLPPPLAGWALLGAVTGAVVGSALWALQLHLIRQDQPPGVALLGGRRVSWRVLGMLTPWMVAETSVLVLGSASSMLWALLGDADGVALVLGFPVCVFAVTTGHTRRTIWRYNRAVRAHLDDAPEEALRRLAPLTRVPGLPAYLGMLRAEVLRDLGRIEEAIAQLEPYWTGAPDLPSLALARLRLAAGDADPARLLLAALPPPPRRGGDRALRAEQTAVTAMLAIEDGEAQAAIASIDGVDETWPPRLERELMLLRAAALQISGRHDEARECLGALDLPSHFLAPPGPPVLRAALVAAGVAERPPEVRGEAVDPANVYAAASVVPRTPPKVQLPYRARRRPPHACLSPLDDRDLGPSVPRQPGLIAIVAVGCGFTAVVSLLLDLPLLGSSLLFACLGGAALWGLTVIPGRHLPRHPPGLPLGDGRYLTEAMLPWLRAQLLAPAAAAACLGALALVAAVVVTPVAGLGPSMVVAWFLRRPPRARLRRLAAAWAVHTAPLDALPDAVVPHRHPDTQGWWGLAHLLAGRTDEAEAILDQASAPALAPLTAWFAAARGELTRAEVGPAVPLAPVPQLLRWGTTLCLHALATGEPLTEEEEALLTEVASADPTRFGGALHWLLAALIRRDRPEEAEAYEAAHAGSIEGGAWVERAWPALARRGEARA